MCFCTSYNPAINPVQSWVIGAWFGVLVVLNLLLPFKINIPSEEP